MIFLGKDLIVFLILLYEFLGELNVGYNKNIFLSIMKYFRIIYIIRILNYILKFNVKLIFNLFKMINFFVLLV